MDNRDDVRMPPVEHPVGPLYAATGRVLSAMNAHARQQVVANAVYARGGCPDVERDKAAPPPAI